MASDDDEIPETGAIFTFGKTRFAENLANKFWIRDDKVLKLACGDEHSAVVTCSGRLYTFGNNDWGQLGHGNTKPYTKPSLVKKLKGDKVKVVSCGRSHTLVISESGIFSFGAGADSQLGHGDNKSYNVPTEIEALSDKVINQVACGAEHSAAVTDNGELYMWGSGSEGQLGLGLAECELPSLLKFRSKVTFVACGYYHTAVITELGKLYTFGDNEMGKLGLEDNQCDDTEQPQQVKTLNEPAVYVACGGNHTAVLTKHGSLFTFGSGMHGQLGHGPAFQDVSLPKLVSALQGKFVSCVSCGESHTAVVTKQGEMFTFGDGRHGKLGMGDESFSNLFKPTNVARFRGFNVEQVSCGGCHMLAVAARKQGDIEDSEGSEDNLREDSDGEDVPDGGETTPRLSQTVPMLGMSARDKRRQKDNKAVSLASSLPPLNRSSLPPLASLGISNIKKEDIKPSSNSRLNPLDRSTLPIISIKGPSPDDEENSTEKQQLSNSRRLPPRPKRRQKRTQTTSDSEEESNREQKGSTTPRPTPPPRKQKPVKDNQRNNEDNIKKSQKEQKGRDAVEKSGSEASDEDSEEDNGNHSTDNPNSRNLTEGKERKTAEQSNETTENVSEEDVEEEDSEDEGSGGRERKADERKEDGRSGKENGKAKDKEGKDMEGDKGDADYDDDEEESEDEETDEGDEAGDNVNGTSTKTSLEKYENEEPEVTNVEAVDNEKEEDEDKKKKDNSKDSNEGKKDKKDTKKKGKTKEDEDEQKDSKEKENKKDKRKDKEKKEKKKDKNKGKEEQENGEDEEENEEDNKIKDNEKENDASTSKEGKKTKKSGICILL